MKRHHFHFHFSTCWGFLRASIDLCVQNMCHHQSCLAAPGVLLLRAMATIRELDEVKLDPYWIFCQHCVTQWRLPVAHCFHVHWAYPGIPWGMEWKAAPWQAGWCTYSLLLGSHWVVGFKIHPFAFLQVLQELLCQKRLEQFICSPLGTPLSPWLLLGDLPSCWTLEKWWW